MLFDFEVAGDKLVSRKIIGVGDRVTDARPAFREIADYWRELERALFESEGASGRSRWKPVTEATAVAKSRAGLDQRILHATRALRRSLTERGAPDQILEMGRSWLVFGSSHEAAAVHQRGTATMPQRRPIDFTEIQKRRTIKILQRFVVTGEIGRSP